MFMKKNRLFSLILALGLVSQSMLAPVYANPEDDDPVPSTSVSQPSEPTGGTTAPTVFVIPENITGDASVHMGSRTLDAQRPLRDVNDYTADAKGAFAYDLNSDTVVFAQEADTRLFPASLTKVMTALLTIEMQPDLDVVVTVTPAGLEGMEPGGSNVSLQVGEQMTVRDLLYCLMVKSGNDAASVLAVQNSGSIEAFVEVMNQRAVELGCTGTHFMNPHGLHHDEHYTTARDVAKILAAALQQPFFEEIFTTTEYTVPATNLSEARELTTTNFLIRSGGYPTVVDSRVLGGKTGNTSKAGRCLVTVSEKGGMKLLTVILGAKAIYGEDGYSFIRYGNFEETSNLLDFCYDAFETAQVLTDNQVVGQFPVSAGDHDAFGLVAEGMYAVVPKGSGYESVTYEYDLTEEPLTAPVKKDQQIGVVRVWYEDKCIAQQPMLAASDVAVKAQNPTLEEQNDTPEADNSLLHKLLIGAVIVLALVGLFVVVVRVRAAMRRARRRKARAKRANRSGTTQRRRR